MTGHLDDALRTLLLQALPGLFGDATTAVRASIAIGPFELDPGSVEAQANEPRTDERIDELPFDPTRPNGPYTLPQAPAVGPRRLRLMTAGGDRMAIADSEVVVDTLDPRRFSLRLRADRDLSGVSGVQVLYSITAVFTCLKLTRHLTLRLEATDAAMLDRAEAMALVVFALNRPQLVAAARDAFLEGDYGAQIELKSLHLKQGTAPSANVRQLEFRAEIELKATRALADNEGMPIERIRTNAIPADPT